MKKRMKVKMKKVLALLLGVAFTASMLAGCGTTNKATDPEPKRTNETPAANEKMPENNETAVGVDTSEHVELKMYLIGDRTADFDEVYGKINEILEEKLNCSLSVDFLSWGEHDTKYSLLFSAEEDFDLIFTASSWCHYEQTVALGGFHPMSEEFVQTYAPDIWKVVPAVAWNQAKIDGQAYMVPNYQNEFGQDVIAVRGDLMKKYGYENITSWDELMGFYKACAQDGIYASQGGPWYQFFQTQGLSTTGGAPKAGELFLYHTQDASDLNFTYLLDWEGFTEYCMEMKALADAGCWSPDVLNSNDERQTGLLTGRTASMIWNLGSCRIYAKQANTENPDWNVTICDPVSSQPKKVNSYINNGVAINASSKNKERAMMVLNEFYTNPAVYDLAMLGIEGKHWEAVGDDEYKVIDESGYGVSSNCNWGWNNMTITRTEFTENRTALDDTFDQLHGGFNNNIKPEHPYDGFTFDSTNVTTQVASVEAAIGTYYDPLVNGLVDDVDVAISELKTSLESAGVRDIQAELERQAAEFIANK
jgi:putative aldouronate transport system substrate-binding protein